MDIRSIKDREYTVSATRWKPAYTALHPTRMSGVWLNRASRRNYIRTGNLVQL